MISEGIEVIKTAYIRASGNQKYIVLYLIALVFSFLYLKEKNSKKLIIDYFVIASLIIFNPLVAWFLNKYLTAGVYWRLFWCLPLGISIAYMFTEIVFLGDNKIKKIFLLIISILIIVYAGTLIYKNNVFVKVGNWYKIPDDELTAINIILEETKQWDKEPMLFAPPEMIAHIRQISSNIKLSYIRIPSGDYSKNKIYMNLISNEYSKAIKLLKEQECDYLVWNKQANIMNENIELINTTQNYNIYKINK